MKPRRPRRQRRAARPEAGSTLVEVLAAIVLMSTAIVVLATGMTALLVSSNQTRQATTAGVVARDYAEALVVAVSQPGAWCSTSYPVSYTPPTGYSVTATFGACPATSPTTPQFQTADVAATPAGGRTEHLHVVLRET